MDLPTFLKANGDALLFNEQDKEMIFYIPEKYFERNIAEQIGDEFNLIGIFDYTIQDLKTGKNNGLHNFRFPSFFKTVPFSSEKAKQLTLIKQSKPTDYRILRYRYGSEVIQSTKVIQFIGNVEKVNNLIFVLGYIINTIPYDKIFEYVIDAMNINGEDYGLNFQMFGVVLSEICRSTKDINIPYRLSGSKDLHDYQSVSIKQVSKLISPYTALISENFDESMAYAMMNDDPKDNPLERILIGDAN